MADEPASGPGREVVTAQLVKKAASWPRFIALIVVAVVVPLGIIPLAEYVAVAPWGSTFLLEVVEPPVILFGFTAFLAVLASPGMCVFARDRWQLLRLVVLSLVYLAALVGGVLLGREIRRDGFRQLAQRSAPLVAAIKAYEAQHGRPPTSLAEVVPEGAASEPWTGMGAYPHYEYEQGATTAKEFDGNPWVLYVWCPSGLINWDRFLYYPRQNYPHRGHGGWLERMGGWAYVHE